METQYALKEQKTRTKFWYTHFKKRYHSADPTRR